MMEYVSFRDPRDDGRSTHMTTLYKKIVNVLDMDAMIQMHVITIQMQFRF